MQGRTLSHYRILEKIGEGTMGVVFQARDLHLERDVALKVLPPGSLAEDDARRRFRKEALSLSQLNHPNVAAVYDFDSEQGIDFLVMELIPGVSLAEHLARGVPTEVEAVALAIQLADGLASAHERGVIHRDLKPANVRITPEGRLKVVDFGLARQHGTGAEATVTATLTHAGGAVGTLAYMAPEVLGGAHGDLRADVFALGVVLYEMSTGRHPFPAENPIALMYAMLNHTPAAPRRLNPRLSAGFEAVIVKAMHRDPARRFAHAGEVLAELRSLAGGGRRRTARAPGRRARTRIRSLAVLPLENLSGDSSQEYFTDGMTEALIADLAKIAGLRVISRTSAMRYKGARRPLPEIAAELDVDAVVEGSVMRAGDRVRIMAQLIHAATDTHLWAETYERDLRDILSLQSEAARAIAREIEIKLSPQTQARLSAARQVDPEAYEAFLRGRYYANRRTEESLRKGIEYFNHAIARDPTYALAHVGLGDAYNLLGYFSYLAPRDAFPKAKAAAARALEIDPGLGEAHVSLAYVHLYFDWDEPASEREFRHGIELNPNYTQAHLWYANLLVSQGRFDEALASTGRAISLDPLSLVINLGQGWVHYFMRDYDRSILELNKGREMDPTFAPTRLSLAWVHLQRRMFPEAIAEFEAAAQHAGHATLMECSLAHACAAAGDVERAREILARMLDPSETRHLPPFLMAWTYEALGELERAVEWLERAVEERAHWLVFIDVEPRFDALRDDSRFASIRRRVKSSPAT